VVGETGGTAPQECSPGFGRSQQTYRPPPRLALIPPQVAGGRSSTASPPSFVLSRGDSSLPRKYPPTALPFLSFLGKNPQNRLGPRPAPPTVLKFRPKTIPRSFPPATRWGPASFYPPEGLATPWPWGSLSVTEHEWTMLFPPPLFPGPPLPPPPCPGDHPHLPAPGTPAGPRTTTTMSTWALSPPPTTTLPPPARAVSHRKSSPPAFYLPTPPSREPGPFSYQISAFPDASRPHRPPSPPGWVSPPRKPVCPCFEPSSPRLNAPAPLHGPPRLAHLSTADVGGGVGGFPLHPGPGASPPPRRAGGGHWWLPSPPPPMDLAGGSGGDGTSRARVGGPLGEAPGPPEFAAGGGFPPPSPARVSIAAPPSLGEKSPQGGNPIRLRWCVPS